MSHIRQVFSGLVVRCVLSVLHLLNNDNDDDDDDDDDIVICYTLSLKMDYNMSTNERKHYKLIIVLWKLHR